jgi:beta-phosphoglucomutase-like phosphatase (HAD superfamily)
MSELKALLFDVDGTLVDTKELHRQAFNEAFLAFGLGWNWSDELYAELLTVSGGAERIAHYIDWLRPAAEKTRLRRLISAVHREKTRIYRTLIASNKALLGPGVGRLIEEAHEAGLKIGLAASSAVEDVHALLAAAMYPAQRDAMRAIVSANQVNRKKPAPEHLRNAANPTGRSGGGVRRIRGFDQWHRGRQGRPPRHGREPSRWISVTPISWSTAWASRICRSPPAVPRASAERAGSGYRLRAYARPRHSCAPRACRRERARC